MTATEKMKKWTNKKKDNKVYNSINLVSGYLRRDFKYSFLHLIFFIFIILSYDELDRIVI